MCTGIEIKNSFLFFWNILDEVCIFILKICLEDLPPPHILKFWVYIAFLNVIRF